jgi:hypothetical protein
MANFASKDVKFQAAFVLSPISCGDNSKDGVTNNDSNTNIKIVNPTLG